MKKFLSFALTLTMLLTLAIPAFAAPANSNQDFTGTPVDVDAPESVYVDEETQIAITIENVKDRGLPDVSIWVDDVCVKSYSEIGKGKSVKYVIDVDTAEAGIQAFDIVIWTRLGNKNFQDQLYAGTTTIEVVAPVVEETTLLDKLNDAIKNGDFYGDGPIVLVVDDTDYEFTSKSGNYNGNGSLFCTVDDVEYRLERNNHGLIGVYIN